MSLLAIAALASCQNDEVNPEAGKGQEAKVTLRVQGSKTLSRAAGLGADENSKVNNLSVFFYNAQGNLVSKEFVTLTAGTAQKTLNTTTEAKKVVVIANTGDLMNTAFLNVSSIDVLKQVTAKLFNGDLADAATSQQDNNLFMSGMANVTDFALDGADMKATATVTLKFIGSKIILKKIDWTNITGGEYGTTFKINRIYLMDAQTNTHFIPATDNGTDYIALTDRAFAGGRDWTDPWPTRTDDYKVYNELSQVMPIVTTEKSVTDIAHWYVFSNITTSTGHPTAVVVEANWKSVGAATDLNDATTGVVKKYFTVHFDGNDAESNHLESGKSYDLSITLKGNFKPTEEGGNGGGGTENPDKPTVNSSVDVTITPATWNVVTINKDFD